MLKDEHNKAEENLKSEPLISAVETNSGTDINKVINTKSLKDLETDEEDFRNEIEIIDDQNNKRTMCGKYFSKIEPGSLRASVFSLSILSIGIGCLALPKVFGQVSIMMCSILVILSAIATYWTLGIIIEAGRKKNLNVYSVVISEYCGYGWSVFYDCIMVLYLYGVLIIFQIISKQ